ncbi:hypothetical protein STCU_10396 [Strigomonas culicis]|uniref:Uncharacterized protein n=1 Tax=Strigomonas culicis TaxID=28005 RepID=S9TI89_9TRYP|nr:hypothetical protein STCU_10396 [Strigomonas culicis]|eukprot:EPY17802.1 hypothetical protein STCU_10396 [Strigomonas culicis]
MYRSATTTAKSNLPPPSFSVSQSSFLSSLSSPQRHGQRAPSAAAGKPRRRSGGGGGTATGSPFVEVDLLLRAEEHRNNDYFESLHQLNDSWGGAGSSSSSGPRAYANRPAAATATCTPHGHTLGLLERSLLTPLRTADASKC